MLGVAEDRLQRAKAARSDAGPARCLATTATATRFRRVAVLHIGLHLLDVGTVEAASRGEVANRWRYKEGGGEVGVISSVTQPFCGDCTRARLSADGKLYTCLFAFRGHDFRTLLRSGASDADLATFLRSTWSKRDDRYSELRAAGTAPRDHVEMSYIGG